MIFVNGGNNPSAVSFEGTSLENVYYNGTLVWTQDKSETSGSGSGTTPMYDSSGNISGYAADVPDSVFSEQSGGQSVPSSTIDTVKFYFGPGRSFSMNDNEKNSIVWFVDRNKSEVVATGCYYNTTVSAQLVFNTSDYVTVDGGIFYVFDSGTKYGEEYVYWTGVPDGLSPIAKLPIRLDEDVTVTCNVKLSGGGTTTRVYSGRLIIRPGAVYIYGDARGDEESIAPATSGYVLQESGKLWFVCD